MAKLSNSARRAAPAAPPAKVKARAADMGKKAAITDALNKSQAGVSNPIR